MVTTITRERPSLDTGDAREAFHLQILGPLRIWRHGVEADAGSRQQRCVLALLLASGGDPVSRSQLVDLLWGDAPPVSAVNTVQKYMGALRRVLEPDLRPRASGQWLVRHGTGYQFNAEPDVLDLTSFRRAAAAARDSLAQGDEPAALERRIEALGWWHGPAADGLAETPDAQTIFDTLNREYLDLAVSAARLARRRNRPRLVLDALWQAAAVGPLHEPLHAELIANLALAGQHAEAVAAYRAIRGRLAGELGIDPSPALQLAYREIAATPVPAPRRGTPRGGTRRKRPAQLPADLPSFVGRLEILSSVRDLLTRPESAGRTPAIVAFDGMPGVGKTVLALRLAHELAPAYPDGQLHLDLRGFAEHDRPVTAEEALRDLISGLGVEQRRIPGGRQVMAGLYRTLLRGRRVLVVLDDARSIDQVADLLPSSAGCLVLLTSRGRMPGLRTASGAYLVPVGLPEHDEARAHLARHFGARPAPADSHAMDTLVHRCGRLPLALAHAGVRAAAYSGVPLRETVEALQHAGVGVDQAFARSYRELGAPAAHLFRSLATALDPGRNITPQEAAAITTAPLSAARSMLDELHQVGLLQEIRPGRYDWHVLVRAYAAGLPATG